MTELLFLKDSYIREFDSVVKEVNGKFVVLDQTAFYPNGGGQPNDIGEFVTQSGEKFEVLFVKKMGADVSHEVNKEGLREGEIVHGSLNWDTRYRYMRYHTAAHILAAVIHRKTGAKISGNQIALDKTRVDFNLEKFDREQIGDFLREVNGIIGSGVDVIIEDMDRDDAFKIPDVVKLRDLLPPAIEKIRIVTIMGVDKQACGGTHVSNTKEIGPIEIVKAENKGLSNRRIYFVLKE